jgi:arylsulfatase A
MSQPMVSRRKFIRNVSTGLTGLSLSQILSCKQVLTKGERPNVIIIFCDDLGYGDLGVYGHPTIRTPHLDRMCAEGQKWTNFYAAASVCTPSRAGLLTGRLPVRSGMCSDKRGVLFPDSAGGLPEDEITIAEMVKAKGYQTACIGKWHLGHLPPYLPTKNGFDTYYGIPYSNDMDRIAGVDWKEAAFNAKIDYYNVPIMRNEAIIERPANQHTLTRRYTEEAVSFIKKAGMQPFFLYLAHSMPHIPLFRSDQFKNTSVRGIYGDVIEEIDWGVGRILAALEEQGIVENTLVVFTSDNGPWLTFKTHGGSAGLLWEGKGTTYEGGMREPTIFYWPGTVQPEIVTGIGSTLDLFATIAALAGASMPDDRIMDSENLLPVLQGKGSSPREVMFFYRGTRLYAVRKGAYKAHFITESSYQTNNIRQEHDPPLLFNVEHDPSEKFNLADQHPGVLAEINAIVQAHESNLVKGKDQLAARIQ